MSFRSVRDAVQDTRGDSPPFREDVLPGGGGAHWKEGADGSLCIAGILVYIAGDPVLKKRNKLVVVAHAGRIC